MKPALYSFRDLLALRAFAHLPQDPSLQKIRKAQVTLKRHGKIEDLSSYSLVAEDDVIVLACDTGAHPRPDRSTCPGIVQAVHTLLTCAY